MDVSMPIFSRRHRAMLDELIDALSATVANLPEDDDGSGERIVEAMLLRLEYVRMLDGVGVERPANVG